MTLAVTTNSTLPASTLLSLIYEGIQKKHILTWAIHDQDGVRYLTHTPEQWRAKGFLKLEVASGILKGVFVSAQNVPPTDEIKGVYQGRFAEMLYAHDQSLFRSGVANIAIVVD